METKEAAIVTATATATDYEVIASCENVLINIPSIDDRYLKFINKHQITTTTGPHTVNSHGRRGIIVDGAMVTVNYYLQLDQYGRKIVADKVNLVQRTNKDGISIVIDVFCGLKKKNINPTHRLKVGSPFGEFPIPETERFIRFEKM